MVFTLASKGNIMQVGDLVHLNKDQYYEHDEYLGVIVDIDGENVYVWWSSGIQEWLYDEELEAINESR